MTRSNYKFDRWKPRDHSTWAFRVFKQHNVEMLRMYTAFENSRVLTYGHLGKVAKWDELPSTHLTFKKPLGYEQFDSMRDWSSAYNDLENWLNLNTLVAISSNLETYLGTVVPLALSSDVGVLYGASRRIDGIQILKHGNENSLNFEEQSKACTKGDWSSRLSAYESYFGRSPKFFSTNISSLEKVRKIRNDVAHAFGRDIDESRNRQQLKTSPGHKLSRSSLLKLQKVVWQMAKSVDAHLQRFHIGEYQALMFYHGIYPELRKDVHASIRAMALKKKIGGFGDNPAGKEFCKGLVAYYESL